MQNLNHVTFSEKYFKPVIDHPVTRYGFMIVAEVVKIVAAKMFLEFLSRRLWNHSSKLPFRNVYIAVVFAPVVEEIIFRGILLRGIHLIQKVFRKVCLSGGAISEQTRKTDQIFRVHLAALIFAGSHLLNPHRNAVSAGIQFCWTYIGGVTYGYLSEKYQSLAPGMIVHGINNSLATSATLHPKMMPWCLLALMVNKLAAYILAITEIDTKFFSHVSQFAHGIFKGSDDATEVLEVQQAV
jgi:membrane protease YdiL (CAAX protease family)